jgi:two-component system sensor histidine kinase ChvG
VELRVSGIEDRLGQVLRNLIANAVSFSPPGGRISLAAARVGGMVEISVSDEGPGIPEASLERIFERFYSSRPEGEKFGTHSGLGLSISRQIVSAHGGTLRAENRPGTDGRPGGARFVIALPAE